MLPTSAEPMVGAEQEAAKDAAANQAPELEDRTSQQ
jgi:hypothetical protein